METIALYKFKEQYTLWIGIVFLFSLGLSIINILEYFKKLYKIKKDKDKYQNILDEDELINIREFYLQKKIQ